MLVVVGIDCITLGHSIARKKDRLSIRLGVGFAGGLDRLCSSLHPQFCQLGESVTTDESHEVNMTYSFRLLCGEELVVGPLGRAGSGPAGDEGIKVCG